MKKRCWIEAILSIFIVGFGQIIKGESKKGLKLLLVFYFALPALAYVALLIYAQLFLIILSLVLLANIILWLYNIWDASLPCLPAGRNKWNDLLNY